MLLLAMAQGAPAADVNGEFALEGAGKASCARYLKALEEDSTDVLLFGGWMHGYLSAINRYESGTYDIATWPSQQQQLQFLANVCRGKPQARFFEAVALMADQLSGERLAEKEPLVNVGQLSDGSMLSLYPSTLERVRARLNELSPGSFTEPLSRDWDDALQSALKSYQVSLQIEETGLPDPETLLRLFRE